MYNIEFYETADGVSELWDFLDGLQQKAPSNKDARIQHKQILNIFSCFRIMVPGWVRTSPSTSKKTSGNSVPEETECSSSITRTTPTCSFTIS